MSLQDGMMIVMGGWRDARRQAIEEEVMDFLDRSGVKDQVHSVTVPYVRSSSARIMLNITEDLGLALAHKKQVNTVTALKTMTGLQDPRPIDPQQKELKSKLLSLSRASLLAKASPQKVSTEMRGKLWLGELDVWK